MNRIRRILSSLILSVFVFASALPALAASEYEDAMAKSMRGALMKTGMSPKMASDVAQQSAFFGIVMLKDVQVQLLGNQREKLLLQAGRVGAALGTALGSAFKTYGSREMQETPAVMMHAVRAGVIPEAASETFAALAQGGYAFEAAKQVIHEASEVVRSEKFADAGAELCRDIRRIAAKKGPVQELRREIVSAARAEKARQLALLAKNEEERRDSKGGGDRAMGRQTAAAGAAAASSSAGRGTAAQAADSGRSPAGGRASGSAPSGGKSDAGGSASGSAGAANSGGGSSGAGASDGASGGASDGKSGSDSSGGASGGQSGSGSSGGQSGSASGGGASDGKGGADGSSGSGGNSNGASGSEGAGASAGGAVK